MNELTNLSSTVFSDNCSSVAVLRRCNTAVNPHRYIIKCPYCSSFTSLVTMAGRSIKQDDQLLYCYDDGQEQWLRIVHSSYTPANLPLTREEMHIDILECDSNFEAENSALSLAKADVGRSSFVANEILLGITGQASMCLMGIYISANSFPPALYYVVGANAVGFVGIFSAMFLREKRRRLSGVLAKVGAVGAASATMGALGMFLPVNFIWTAGVTFVVSAFALAIS